MLRHRNNQQAVDCLLLRAKVDNAIVPFVGAGLSLPWTSLGWAAFLNELAAKTAMSGKSASLPAQVSQDLAAGRYEEAAERIQQVAGRPAFNDAIYDVFGDHALSSPAGRTAMGLLPRIALGPVVTTNFDRVLEQTYRKSGAAFGLILWGAKAELASDALVEDQHVLLKIHGDVGDDEDRILTRSEYDRHYGLRKPLAATLLRLFRNHSILFLGCSLNSDRYLPLLREAQRRGAPEHFACVAAPDASDAMEKRREQLKAWGITPIWMDRRYSDLPLLLEHLAKQRRAAPPKAPTRAAEFSKADRERRAILARWRSMKGPVRLKVAHEQVERLSILGFYEDAIRLANEAGELALRINDRLAAADLYFGAYLFLRSIGGPHNQTEARRFRRRASALLRGQPLTYLHVGLADDITVRLLDWSANRHVVHSARRALRVAEQYGRNKLPLRDRVQLQRHLGHALEWTGDQAAAVGALQKAVRQAGRSLPLERAETLRGLASIYAAQGQPVKTRRALKEAIRLFRSAGSYRALARAINDLGVSYYEFGDHHQALRCYREAMDYHQQIGNEAGTMSVLSNLAWLHYEQATSAHETLRLASLRRSFEYFSQIMSLARHLRDDWRIATVRAQRSHVSWQLGRRAEARRDIAIAIRFFERRNDRSSLAFSWNNKGVIHDWDGEGAKALKAYDRGIAFAEPAQDYSQIERLLENKAASLRASGHLHEAQRIEKQRQAIWPH